MRVAVFVDAGFLFAACSSARFKEPSERVSFDLNNAAVLDHLRSEAVALDGGGGRLVRIYWYDAAVNYTAGPHHLRVWDNNDVKVRLGVLRRHPDKAQAVQKGVDSLIVHDLLELARHQAIDAALLLSGDEDLVVGMTAAQAFGVRVHLLGIQGAGVAQRLRLEADAYHEWTQELVAPWVIALSETSGAATRGSWASRPAEKAPRRSIREIDMAPVVDEVLGQADLRAVTLWAGLEETGTIPHKVDRLLFNLVAEKLERWPTGHENIAIRALFRESLRGRAAGES